ncbi:MAG TPA: LysM peptidoglycan-binding domain-containing protein [Pyrinomonadaceae bacterium]|jgi:nucleoid-associated protein YgaU|nr:LysM peptidoglycan-binding domain-containing protein [Pyrinomonadaceae bacterium]
MGFWDKMFGRGASEAQKQPDAQQRYNELVQKYQSALNLADQEQIQFHNLHVQDNKLYIKGIAPSLEARTRFGDQLRLVNPNGDDVTAEIEIVENRAQGASVGGGSSPAVTHTVQSGDTLSKISKEYYGSSDEYMRIFYANRDKLRDPDRIQVGQELVIPADDNG